MAEIFRWITRLWKTGTDDSITVDEKSGPDNLINDCKQCGKTNYARGLQPKLYCGPKCYQRYKRAQKKKYSRPKIKCLECGDEFVPIRDNHVRCSRNCRYLNQRRYQKANLKKYKSPRVERKPCDHCGQLFLPAKYTEKYCNYYCKKDAEYRPPRLKLAETKREIKESDLNTSKYADEIAAFKAKGGKISVAPGLPDPKVDNINLGVKKGKDGAEWDAKDLADLDQYEDVINLTNNF